MSVETAGLAAAPQEHQPGDDSEFVGTGDVYEGFEEEREVDAEIEEAERLQESAVVLPFDTGRETPQESEPSVETEAVENKTPETPPSILERESRTRFQEVQNFISNDAKEMFSNLDDKAKVIASGAYETMIRTPLDRMVSKVGIAWNQMWIDRRQGQANRINSKIGAVDAEMATHEKSITTLQGTIDRLKSIDPQSASKLERSMEDLRARQDNLATHRSGLELQVSRKNASIEAVSNERNRIAEHMQQRYAEHLRPIDAKMEKLENEKAQLGFEMELKRAEMAQHEREAKDLEGERDKLLLLSQELGFFQRQGVNQAIKRLDAQIMSARSEIAISQNKMNIAQNRINLKIDAQEQKARPFKDRQREFTRVVNRSNQTVEATPAPASAAVERVMDDFDSSIEYTDSSVHGVGKLIENWNKYLGDHHDSDTSKVMTIDAEEFLRGTRGWTADSPVEFEQFTKIIKSYYERSARQNKSIDLGVLDKAKDRFTNESVSE